MIIIINIITAIIEIYDIIAIILLRVNLLLMTWYNVNIVFYLFRYYYYYFFFCCSRRVSYATRFVPMDAEFDFSRSLRGKKFMSRMGGA